jgi:hypothetical protein
MARRPETVSSISGGGSGVGQARIIVLKRCRRARSPAGKAPSQGRRCQHAIKHRPRLILGRCDRQNRFQARLARKRAFFAWTWVFIAETDGARFRR